jgi:hypothetical protein
VTKITLHIIWVSLFILSCDSDNQVENKNLVDTNVDTIPEMDSWKIDYYNFTDQMLQKSLSEKKLSAEEEKEIRQFFSQMNLDMEYVDSLRNSLKSRSPATLLACFEGTQNQAILTFREDSTFDLLWTGIFSSYHFHEGLYEANADTIILNYTTDKPYRFGEKILNTGTQLETLDIPVDSNQYFVPFYLGECLGLN